MKKIDIIGAGLSGLYAACKLAKSGYEVHVYEKNESAGGRSRVFEAEGFRFDMGPSWYWMPELIDGLFEEIGEKREDYFQLKRLDPAYRIFWKDHELTDLPVHSADLEILFDRFEKDGGRKLNQFLDQAKKKYEIATAQFIEKPGLKLSEIVSFQTLKYGLQLDLLKSVDKDVSRRFSSPYARAILNFPVLFLGAMPNRIPSLYTMMNYADMRLGTWYPEGGMGALPAALLNIALNEGVQFHYESELKEITCKNNEVTGIRINDRHLGSDQIIVSADYRHVEQEILPKKYRKYSKEYWDNRKMAPSCLIFYIGVNKRINNLLHHNLFFDEDLQTHGESIYNTATWPESPLFYVCAPSQTDKEVAPEDHENLFVLIPIAPDLEDREDIREKYFQMVIERIQKHVGEQFAENIVYKRSYCVSDFKQDYHAFKGNAYGLANTLGQTANLKPKIKTKLSNLYFCGQLTVPGPGVPPALISGKIVANQLISEL